ncbi:MAG: hypothetical protein JNM43_09965 [Planctomycetaceae bacterium]|nr:hypothetical protein [Planctomycetaceae bacterium]
MSGRIYLLGDDDKLIPMEEAKYDTERLLQELLAKYPDLLAGEQMNPEEPRRWLLVTREMSVPDEDEGAGRWSVDHLFLDQDAIPTLVEVKRSTDTRIRREVVGQMLDYAANAVVYWPVEQIQSKFQWRCESEGGDPEEELAGFLRGSCAPDDFWVNVKTNLQAGRVRLVFVSDVIPTELRRVVEFLNAQMDPAEVLAIEVRQFVGDRMKTLVPRVLGQTESARQKRSATTSTDFGIEASEFLRQVDEGRSKDEANTIRRLIDWARNAGLRDNFNQRAKGSSFTPALDHDGGRVFPVSVQQKGMVVIQLRWLKDHEPFVSIPKRNELLRRLQELPELRTTDSSLEGYPKIPVSVLKDEAQFQKLKAILDWIVEEIRTSDVMDISQDAVVRAEE